jgi:hypothetical protein
MYVYKTLTKSRIVAGIGRGLATAPWTAEEHAGN